MFNGNTTQNNFYAIIILFHIKIYKKRLFISIVFKGRAAQIKFYLNNNNFLLILCLTGKQLKQFLPKL